MSKEFFHRHARYPSHHESPKSPRFRRTDKPTEKYVYYDVIKYTNTATSKRTITTPPGKESVFLGSYVAGHGLRFDLGKQVHVVFDPRLVEIKVVSPTQSSSIKETRKQLSQDGWILLPKYPLIINKVVGYRAKPRR